MRSAVGSSQPDAFRRNGLRDCDRMEASLMPIARHSMWEEVAMRDLLELKNIALLEGPPVRSGRPTSGPRHTDFAAGGTVEWASGVRLVYNQHFSRSLARRRHSYSVPLRPVSRFRCPTAASLTSTSSTRRSGFMGSPMWDLRGPTRTGTTTMPERERALSSAETSTRCTRIMLGGGSGMSTTPHIL